MATERARMFAPEGFAIPASRNSCPTTDQVRRETARSVAPIPVEMETAIVASLTRAPSPGESYRGAAEQREHELRGLFSQLSATQALALARRLDIDGDADGVAVAFRRMTSDRRRRLRAYLADAARRIALSGATCPLGGSNDGERA